MLKSINNKISLGLISATTLLPYSKVFAVSPGGSGTCDGKTFYVPDLNPESSTSPNCYAFCTNGKVEKFGDAAKTKTSPAECIITYGKDDITVLEVINKVVGWLTTLVGIIAVLFLIYGGLVYITSAGNKDRAENAKKTITYSVIGLIVVVLARVVVALVVNTAGEAI